MMTAKPRTRCKANILYKICYGKQK